MRIPNVSVYMLRDNKYKTYSTKIKNYWKNFVISGYKVYALGHKNTPSRQFY